MCSEHLADFAFRFSLLFDSNYFIISYVFLIYCIDNFGSLCLISECLGVCRIFLLLFSDLISCSFRSPFVQPYSCWATALFWVPWSSQSHCAAVDQSVQLCWLARISFLCIWSTCSFSSWGMWCLQLYWSLSMASDSFASLILYLWYYRHAYLGFSHF